jgi:alpha-amylase/alpha-mannosidase (GH57 family)
MGGNYEPWGIWTPEMAFSMSLVSIYYDNGIKYTVLDDQHHFHWAEGDKDSQYEPYILVDTSTRKSIIVFFRDHELSDILGFKNNFYSEPHAWRNAYETAYLITEKWLDQGVKTLILALDGENWMVFPKNKHFTAYYLKHLIIYLEAVQDLGFIKLSTLREMYNEVPSRRVLTKIPTNSWLGTFRKWRGEIHEHEKYWYHIADTYRRLRAYESIIQIRPGEEEISRRIRWALWHALDSDYWWAEF